MDRKRRIVWLTVNSSYSHSSLALPLIHAQCKEIPGWKWERCEVTKEADPAETAALITKTTCDLLCAALYLFNREIVLDILKRVHVLSPDTHIAVGGPECPACDAPGMLEQYPFLSSIFSGEGEATFPEFLRCFEENRNSRRCYSGLFHRWAESPFPAEDPFFRTDKPFVQIETSRGCPMACSYCTSSGVIQRYRKISDTEKELALLSAKGVREIRVLDRTFNLPEKRGSELLNLFRKFPEMHFHLEVHPEYIGQELRECFRNAIPGQFHIEAGIQSLDRAVQKAIGRNSIPEKAEEGIRFLTSCSGFETHTDLLAGLPEQTPASLKQDLVRLMKLHPGEIQLEVLKILPGTPVKTKTAEYGIVYSPDPPYDVMRTCTMTADEILEARHLSRLLDLYYNHNALHPVLCTAVRENENFFLQFAEKADTNRKELKRRFLDLAVFLNGFSMAETETEFAVQWLKSGFPVPELPFPHAEIAHKIPDEAVLLVGNAACRTQRESRFWQIQRKHDTVYLAFNRNFSQAKPCGIWTLERKDEV